MVDGDCFADNDAAWDALTSNIVRQAQGQSPSEFAAALDYLHKRPFYKREIEFLEEAIGADDDDEAALARRMRNLRLECLGLWQFMAYAAQRNNVEAMRRMVAAKLVTFADDRDFLPALRRAVAAGADDAASFLVSLAFSNAAALPRSMVSLDSNIQNNSGREFVPALVVAAGEQSRRGLESLEDGMERIARTLVQCAHLSASAAEHATDAMRNLRNVHDVGPARVPDSTDRISSKHPRYERAVAYVLAWALGSVRNGDTATVTRILRALDAHAPRLLAATNDSQWYTWMYQLGAGHALATTVTFRSERAPQAQATVADVLRVVDYYDFAIDGGGDSWQPLQRPDVVHTFLRCILVRALDGELQGGYDVVYAILDKVRDLFRETYRTLTRRWDAYRQLQHNRDALRQMGLDALVTSAQTSALLGHNRRAPYAHPVDMKDWTDAQYVLAVAAWDSVLAPLLYKAARVRAGGVVGWLLDKRMLLARRLHTGLRTIINAMQARSFKWLGALVAQCIGNPRGLGRSLRIDGSDEPRASSDAPHPLATLATLTLSEYWTSKLGERFAPIIVANNVGVVLVSKALRMHETDSEAGTVFDEDEIVSRAATPTNEADWQVHGNEDEAFCVVAACILRSLAACGDDKTLATYIDTLRDAPPGGLTWSRPADARWAVAARLIQLDDGDALHALLAPRVGHPLFFGEDEYAQLRRMVDAA